MFDDQCYTGGEQNEINHAWNRQRTGNGVL